MKKFLLSISFILLGWAVRAQADTSADYTGGFYIKTDIRALMLQPSFSFEYFFSRHFSMEAGATYFRTGRKIYGDDGMSRMGVVFFGFGPSKGYDLFSDIKFVFKNGAYLGLGYLYKRSHFTNSKQSTEVNRDSYQNFKQSENAYSNVARFTFGYLSQKSRHFILNPYATLMFGQSKLQLTIDTVDATNYQYYKPVVLPLNEHRVMRCFFLEIGLKFCLRLNARKPKE